jgi:hypothetical protein
MSGRDRGVRITVVGGPTRTERDRGIHLNQVTPAYFDTVGIRLLAGRWFTARDQANSQRVAILNDAAARSDFGENDPIGRKVSFPGQRVTDQYELVGIVRDAKYQNLRNPADRMVYLPISQSLDRIGGLMVAVRSAVDARSLLPQSATKFAPPYRAGL